MPSLGIPLPYRGPLAALAGLDNDDAALLSDRLEALSAYASVADIDRTVVDVIGNKAPGLAASLLALRGLLRTLAADEIGQALSQSSDLNLAPDSRELLDRRATALLKTAALSTTAVAVDLQTQHSLNFQGARILTDLRPIFSDEVDEGPTGAVIVEMLQIHTWNRDGRSETLFIALDEKDLVQLQKVVDRALKKTATLRRFVDAAGLAYFQLEEDEEA